MSLTHSDGSGSLRYRQRKPVGEPEDLFPLRVFLGGREGSPIILMAHSLGNVYCGGSGGLWILDPSGRHLGTVAHGAEATTNLAFGGSDWKTLFFTTRNTIGSVQTKIAGLAVPVGR